MKKRLLRFFVLLTAAAILFSWTACTDPTEELKPVASTNPASSQTEAAPKTERKPVAFADAVFHEEEAESVPDGSIDFSAVSDGYIAVRMGGDSRIKFQIQKGDEVYTYDVTTDGSDNILPLNMGDGVYEFRVMVNIEGTKYALGWSDKRTVMMNDEFTTYLRPNQIVSYTENDACVKQAWELTKYCADDVEIAAAIYDYLKENITYDYEKADTVQPGYLPTPDDTLRTKDGICFDYAALAAAMMRSQGVPCQVITGYVGKEELYHAWNRFYIENEGWITAEIRVSKRNWKRVDITFAAAGTAAKDLENESLYTTRYTY